MKGIKIIFTAKELAEKGFDDEIARYMREHKNCAIVGHKPGVNRHVIQYKIREDYNKYCKQFKQEL